MNKLKSLDELFAGRHFDREVIILSTDCGFSEGAEFVCEPHREWLSELARGERLK
ncbi:hypothetical protein [Paraburkholderia sp. UYCP14C]|uniref:hypothetical protein n=1 Tax=Paraburkholderia sp. UYCP14C TaxID=2511130 RepID=UPI002007110E|nr:hypothetical protein [Paraburkholderia sp. UYCP14C]